jgi:uncharacterized protein (TIRG00374 family)
LKPEARRRLRSVAFLAIKLIAAALLVIWLLRSTSAKDIDWPYLRKALERWPLLVMAFVMLFALPALGALRWYLLLRCQGFVVSYWRALHLTLVGMFFNCIGVGYTGGDIIKAYYVARDQERGRRAEAVYTVGFDRAVGLYALLLLGCIGVLCSLQQVFADTSVRNAALAMLGVVAFVTWGFLFMWSKRFANSEKYAPRLEKSMLGGLFLRFYRSVKIYRNKWKVLISTVLISLLAHSLMIAVLWTLGCALDMKEISIAEFAFYSATGMALSSIGPPMGIGFGQFFFGVFFELRWPEFGAKFGFMLSTLQQFVLLAFNTLIGLPAFLVVRRDIAEAKAAMLADEEAAASENSKTRTFPVMGKPPRREDE